MTAVEAPFLWLLDGPRRRFARVVLGKGIREGTSLAGAGPIDVGSWHSMLWWDVVLGNLLVVVRPDGDPLAVELSTHVAGPLSHYGPDGTDGTCVVLLEASDAQAVRGVGAADA